jgi:riboflavin synthase
MFTGIVTEVGRIARVAPEAAGWRLDIAAPRTARGLVRGGSVAVDGVCLTATRIAEGTFSVQVVPETLRRSTLGEAGAGRRVNLERPLRGAGELGGHFVQGHVDARARVIGLDRLGKEVLLEIQLPAPLKGLVVEKGSIAVDGVSLTVARAASRRFTVALVPHTLKATTLGRLEKGSFVNLEADILAKYVRSLLPGKGGRRVTRRGTSDA